MIVELCVGLPHTVEPYFCQHSSTLVNDRNRYFFGNQSVRDRRLIGRVIITITERTGSS